MEFTRFATVDGRRVIVGDWYPGIVPEGIHVHEQAYVGSSYSFLRFRGERADALEIGRGATATDDTTFDIGPAGKVRIGEFAAVNGTRFVCDAQIDIGDYAMVAWDVVLMDSYRTPFDPILRRQYAPFTSRAAEVAAQPICVGRNCWVGFGACVLPGVTIGEGSIVQARAVVAQDVPPNVIVAGNPARVIRVLQPGEGESPHIGLGLGP